MPGSLKCGAPKSVEKELEKVTGFNCTRSRQVRRLRKHERILNKRKASGRRN